MRHRFRSFALLSLLSLSMALSPITTCLTTVNAQTIVGRISGTVTDSSGAVIAGAVVTITNEATRLSRTATSDDSGAYVVTNLPVGVYSVAAEQQGFKKSVRTGHNLVADGRLTVDLVLEPGAVTESVTVSAGGEAVNTTSGELARVIDTAQVQDLALNGRNYTQLTNLIPGAPLLTDDQLGLMTSLGINQPINGNRGNSNLHSVDGGFNMDSGSNNSPINNVGIDFIREVKIQTSNFSAEYGRNAGASINIVTKGGGNEFHGSIFEFLRNNRLDANDFFSNARGRFTADPTAKSPDVIVAPEDPRVGREVVPRAALRYNNFGWSLGGPIKKDKLFFFAGMEWKIIRRFSGAVNRTLPTRAQRLGDFSGISTVVRDPLTRQPFPGNRIPANRITADGQAIAAVYDAMEKLASAYTDTPTANNALFQQPNPFDFRQDIVRIDYQLNERHTLYGRYIHDDYDLIDPFGTFINSQLPTIPTNRRRPASSYQVAHTWVINASLINEAKINASWNGQRIPPFGENWKRETFGFTYPQLFAGGRFDNGIPDVSFGGTGSVAAFRGPASSLLSPTTDIAFSDNITWTRGRHSIKTGALIIRNRKDQNGRSTYTGVANFNTGGNPNTSGHAFADALLGNFRTYSEAADDPIGFFRFTQFDAFVSDNWKVLPNFSIEAGLRYQYGLPIYTQANNIVNFDPRLYHPSQAVTVNPNGTLVPGSGNRFNGLIRGGDGVPDSELARVPNGNSPEVLAVPAGAPRGLYDPQHLFAPRLSFAWSPFVGSKTAIRGGVGFFYDRPEGNLIFSQVNIPPFLSSAQFENGNLSSPSGGAASALAPFGTINAINPELKVPYTVNYSLSIQRELPGGIFGEIAYVGHQARHLLRQPDINQATFEELTANAALPAAQRKSVNALRPFRGFSEIRMRLSDSNSNYNALQLYVAKRKGNLTLTGSYTWSKVLTDSSGNGDNPEDFQNRRFNYGPASFDRTHIFVSTYTYSIPFFRSWKGVQGAVLSGWEISGITRFQSGQYLTITGNSSIGARRADYIGGFVEFPSGARSPRRWFNHTVFQAAPDTRRGNSGVGVVEGPGLELSDLSLRKKFGIREGINLQVQADFFNAFNQTNLRNPNTNASSIDFATISSAAPGRNVQIGLKLTF